MSLIPGTVHMWPMSESTSNHEGQLSDLDTPTTGTDSRPVQPIVLLVDRNEPAAEDDGILAVALASVRAFIDDGGNADLGQWTNWLAGSFTKSVRRADAPTFARIEAQFPDQFSQAQVGTATAIAFPPVVAADMDKKLRKLQVSGTSLPKLPTGEPAHAPAIVLNKQPKLPTLCSPGG